MSEVGLSQTQRTSQIQTQLMSQKQILALKLIGMGSQELRDEIIRQAEENPAIEIISDPFAEGALSVRKKNAPAQKIRTGSAGAAGQVESDTFQQMIESSPDERETLQEHLLHQLNMVTISKKQYDLCEKIICSLDSNGFYLLAPDSLTDRNDPEQDKQFLDDCISIIRHFDPVGICCQNVTESLEIQARQKKNVSSLTLFILHGHLDFITPPSAEKAHKKITSWLDSQNALSFQTEEIPFSRKELSIKSIEDSIRCIQSLDPFPARHFGTQTTAHFIRPDVYVTRENGNLEKEDKDAGLVMDSENTYFKITGAVDTVPVVRIAPDFSEKSADEAAPGSEEKRFIVSQQKAAQSFLDTLDFRQQVIIRSCSFLVSCQKDFFRNGPGHLHPLTQRQFAALLGIHESSVSRMADSKYIRCSWGTFPVKYFFVNAVQKQAAETENSKEKTKSSVKNKGAETQVSSDAVKHEIELILKEQKPEEKRLSDQKIADMLLEKGYKIARRTVAKYRSQLNIESSYNR